MNVEVRDRLSAIFSIIDDNAEAVLELLLLGHLLGDKEKAS